MGTAEVKVGETGNFRQRVGGYRACQIDYVLIWHATYTTPCRKLLGEFFYFYFSLFLSVPCLISRFRGPRSRMAEDDRSPHPVSSVFVQPKSQRVFQRLDGRRVCRGRLNNCILTERTGGGRMDQVSFD
jgi:hypothetical protein